MHSGTRSTGIFQDEGRLDEQQKRILDAEANFYAPLRKTLHKGQQEGIEGANRNSVAWQSVVASRPDLAFGNSADDDAAALASAKWKLQKVGE